MKISIHIILVYTLFLVSCSGNQSPISFNMAYTSEVTVSSSTGIDLPFNLLTPDIETNTEANCEVNNTRKDLIKQILINHLKLSIITPEGEDFSFLKSIEIYLKADGLSELKVAWNTNVSDEETSPLNLVVTTDDISPYIKKDQFSLKCKTVTDEFLAEDYKIGVDANFKVNATLKKK